jgi:sigma-B regulation protein RsbU (phosphoserine phosphatase)
LLAVTREQLQGEFRLARTIQEGLLPTSLPVGEYVAFSAWLEPARDVCGDMYDCFFISPDMLCCLMGNAAARGVPAALLMGRVMPLLRELLHSGLPPSQALENANRVISGYPPTPGKNESLFVSVFVGLLDRRNGRLTWASAGQRPPFTSWGENLLWSEDMPLGLQPDAGYQERETIVPSGGLLFFCNERLLAAPDASGTMFGEERVAVLLREPADDPDATVCAVRAAVLDHCGGQAYEDLAMLALLLRGGLR